MKDLVTKGGGNSRLLKSSIASNTTHAQLIEMLRNGTFPVDFAGLNAAGILQAGTPVNKATLLTDETGSAIGLEENDRTVNNALFALLQNGVKNLHYVEYETSTNWVAPNDIIGKATVICVGGGGGGGGNRNADAGGGGGSGYIEIGSVEITPGQTYRIVIGAGGAGGIGNTGTVQRPATDGDAGGSTSFGSLLTAQGGAGGKQGGTSLGGDGEAGGGAGGRSTTQNGRNGGAGRIYGGGGGAGYGVSNGGAGGTYGAGGGKARTGSDGAAGAKAGQPFSDATLIFGSHATELSVVGTDGFGGVNGKASTTLSSGYGGGGYGSVGGAAGAYGGGGGAGFGGTGGAGNNGGGGGGGYFGAGGDGGSTSGGKAGSRGGGGGGAGVGSSSTYYGGGQGGSGVVAIIYWTREAAL